MNMVLRLPEDICSERIPLHDFRRARRIPVETRGRMVGGVVVLVGHIALVAAVVWAGSKVYDIVVPPRPITVALLAETPKAEIPPPAPPPPHLVTPQIAIVAAPEITIATPPPAAITVQQVKSVAPPVPSSPIAGTGRDSYLARIIAHLDAAKHYPPQARKLHMEGVVQLHFVMDRAGHVLNYDIAKTSGRPILDNEVKALIARAQPLPPIPADWPQQTLNLIVPVEFDLR